MENRWNPNPRENNIFSVIVQKTIQKILRQYVTSNQGFLQIAIHIAHWWRKIITF